MHDPLIYPVLPAEPVPPEQLSRFIPLADDVLWARKHTRSPKRQLELLVILKTFGFLGYFPAPREIPLTIVTASARRLNLPADSDAFAMASASLYRSRAAVRRKLGVEPWTTATRRLLVNRLVSLNQGRAGPNDLLNAAVEYLRQDRIELPALRTLRRLVGSIRARFDQAFCAAIVAPLKEKDRRILEGLMIVPDHEAVSGFERIKQRPARATLKHLTAHIDQLHWLQGLPATLPLISGLGFGKVTDLAEQARVLNVAELRDHSKTRRLALLICLLHIARAESLDQIATLYLRRIHWMWGRAREDLEEWRRNLGGLSQSLVRLLRRMVEEFGRPSPEGSLDDRLGAITSEHGGTEVILRDCNSALEHRVNDPRSFLIRHYRRSRAVLMTLLAALPLDSERPDSWPLELADRLGFMGEDRESVMSLLDVDPNRVASAWKPLVQLPGPGLTVDRRQFEVYAFCEVADALKAGEVFIPGSLAFADYREALVARDLAAEPCQAFLRDRGLLTNKSKVRPHILHSDTRGQTAAAFAIAYLEGIELRPRIKNWRDLVFYKPSRDSNYRHINALFKGTVNWNLIAEHFPDYVQIGASVQTGTLSSSWLLTRLNSTSRRNTLFRAFHELGRVVRTIHMLEVLAEPDLLRPGGSPQNKVEAFHRFSKWLLFGGQGVLRSNDPAEYEKAVHYNELVANAVMLQTVADQTQVIRQLVEEGYPVRAEDLERLSPYATQHLKRFGTYPAGFGAGEPRPPTSLPI